MKVLTGELRGRSLTFRPNAALRPTADRVRKAVMDALREGLAGKNVLDLFSGTGALGIEALSLGAANVVFVEQNSAQARQIAANLRELGVDDRANVLADDAETAARRLAGEGETFDFIFLDPPYGSGLGAKVLSDAPGPLFGAGCIAMLETSPKEKIDPKALLRWQPVQDKRYGDTRVQYFRFKEAAG